MPKRFKYRKQMGGLLDYHGFRTQTEDFLNGIDGRIGNESTLNTSAKTSLVAAINEVNADSGVTAGSYGPSADASPEAGGTIVVPQLTVNAKGKVTGAVDRTVTLPSGGGGAEWVWDPTPIYDEVLTDGFNYDADDGIPYTLPAPVFVNNPESLFICIEGGTLQNGFNHLATLRTGSATVSLSIPVLAGLFSLCVEAVLLHGQYFIMGFCRYRRSSSAYDALPNPPIADIRFLSPMNNAGLSSFELYDSIPAGARVSVYAPVTA